MKQEFNSLLSITDAISKAEPFHQEGWTVHFQYTCDQCSSMVVFDEPDTIYEIGECCVCGHEQTIERVGFVLSKILPDINPDYERFN